MRVLPGVSSIEIIFCDDFQEASSTQEFLEDGIKHLPHLPRDLATRLVICEVFDRISNVSHFPPVAFSSSQAGLLREEGRKFTRVWVCPLTASKKMWQLQELALDYMLAILSPSTSQRIVS